MNRHDPQLLKGIYPTLILKLLSDNTEMYGYEIEKKIKILSDSNFLITQGSLYPILHKLEETGLVKSTIRHVKNRDRKYYSITKKGMTQYGSKKEEVLSIYETLAQFLGAKT